MKPIRFAILAILIAVSFLSMGLFIGIVHAASPTSGWILANNISIQWKDSGGTARDVIWGDASNVINLGSAGMNQVNSNGPIGWAANTKPIASTFGIGADGSGNLFINVPNLDQLYYSVNGANEFALGPIGKIIVYNAKITQGFGVPAIYGVASQKSETGADTNLLTYTPSANAGNYRVCITIDVSAANTATLGWTMTWTDSNGNAQAPTNEPLTKTSPGTAAPALTFSASANDAYSDCETISINNSATNIVVQLTFTGTSFTAKVTATIEQLA